MLSERKNGKRQQEEEAHNNSVKQPEYTEGPQALENFKSLATAILQAAAKKKKWQNKKSASLRACGEGHFLQPKANLGR
jgi:hypothetical protein